MGGIDFRAVRRFLFIYKEAIPPGRGGAVAIGEVSTDRGK